MGKAIRPTWQPPSGRKERSCRLSLRAPGWTLRAAALVLRIAYRRGSLSVVAAREIVDLVALLPIRIDPSPPPPATLPSLALHVQLTSTDAAYLELDLRLQLPIASRHDELAEAAWAAGVGVLAA